MKRNFVTRYRRCNNKKCKYEFKTKEFLSDGWDYRTAVLKIKKIVNDIN